MKLNAVARGKILCTIQSDKLVYKIGEAPKVIVEIKNYTENKITLVKSLDGSSLKFRFPYSFFRIEKLDDISYRQKIYFGCGTNNGIRFSDIVEISPSESFNPYRIYIKPKKTDGDNTNNFPFSDTSYSYDHLINDKENYREKGKYKITYYYSSYAISVDSWKGSGYSMKPEFEKKIIQERLMHITKLNLESNSLIIEFK
jgi:hypothetical protein